MTGPPLDISSIAKQTLMEMALNKVAPTPKNYAAFYARNLAKSGFAPPDESAPAPPSPGGPLALAEPRGLPARADAQARSLRGVLGIVEAFVANLAALFPDNPMLLEQLAIVRDALAAPGDMGKLSAAQSSLTRLSAPALHSHISAARIVAQQMADSFLEQMGTAGAQTAEIGQALERRQGAIASATTQRQILEAVAAMLSDSGSALSALGEAKNRMEATRFQAEEAHDSIRQLEGQLKRASEDAKRDYLTGLLNRRGLDESLAKTYARSATVSLALLDIDNFKSLNDSLGHEAGDRALKKLSEAIRDILQGSASASRMGGEEFLIVFEATDPQDAKKLVEGLQRALTTKYFLEADGNRLITFSAGVAARRPGEDPSATIARADQAMYAAKRLGKNRVEAAPP